MRIVVFLLLLLSVTARAATEYRVDCLGNATCATWPYGTIADNALCESKAIAQTSTGKNKYYGVPGTVEPNKRFARCAAKVVADPTPPPVTPPSLPPAPVPVTASAWTGPQYTDIVNGPANSYLTIYGGALGTSGTVTIGGVPVSVVRWTDTQITVQPTSSGVIAVNGKDTALTFTVVPGKVILVSTAAGIQACIDTANPGDHCVIRGGSYSPAHPQYGSFFSVHHKGGTAQAAIVVMGYPGEVVQFDRTTQTRGFHFYASPGNVVLANLHIDAKQAGIGIGNSGEDCPTNIRIVGNEVKNFWAEGGGDAAISGSGTNYKWLGNYVHDNGGSKLYHALYFDARCANARNSEIAFNRIDRQTGGRGIQIFGDSSRPLITNISVHHNTITDVGLNCILFGDRTGAGMEAHHNVVSRCSNPSFRGKTSDEGNSGSCLRFASSNVQANIYSNTFSECDVDGDSESGGINFDAMSSVTVTNNIVSAKKCVNGTPVGTISGNIWKCAGTTFDKAPSTSEIGKGAL